MIVDPEITPTLLIGPGRWERRRRAWAACPLCEINAMAAIVEVASRPAACCPSCRSARISSKTWSNPRSSTSRCTPTGGVSLQPALLERFPNLLAELLPDDARFADVVRVVDVSGFQLRADIVSQRVVCYSA